MSRTLGGRAALARAAGSAAVTGLAAAAVWWSPDPARWGPTLLAWAGSLVAFAALLSGSDRRRKDAFRAPLPWTRNEVLLFVLLLAAAAALRLWRLDAFPVRLHNDEMSCGMEAAKFVSAGRPPLFATGWFECPNLGFSLLSLPMAVLGPSIFSLRLAAALYGLSALAAAHLFARTLFGPTAAMFLTALGASYPWSLHFGRTGFTYVLAAAATAAALALFASALRSGRALPAGLSGVVLGIGIQTYFAAQLAPLLVAVAALLWAAFVPGSGSRARRLLAISALGAFLAAAPMLRHYVEEPKGAWHRAGEVLVFGASAREHVLDVVKSTRWDRVLAYQLRQVALFPIRGDDHALQFGYEKPFVPVLLWPFALAGAALSLRALAGRDRRREGEAEADAAGRRAGHGIVWAWISLTMAAGGLLTIDPPFSPRLTGMMPIFLFPAAWALAELWERLAARGESGRGRALSSALLAFVAIAGWRNVRDYFVDYALVAPEERRDGIVRLLERSRDVAGVVSFLPGDEEFDYESYRFVAGSLPRVNAASAEGQALLAGGLRPGSRWLVLGRAGAGFPLGLGPGRLELVRWGPVRPGRVDASFDFWVVEAGAAPGR